MLRVADEKARIVEDKMDADGRDDLFGNDDIANELIGDNDNFD